MSADELLDIVDENDIVLLQTTKKDCYERKLRPRIVNIAVIDPVTKNIAIQRRGEHVSWQPLHYCISACGHVGAGENWDEAAARELQEEMGIVSPLTFIGKSDFKDEGGYDFMLATYVTEYPHSKLIQSQNEVYEILSLTRNEINALIQANEKIHNLFLPVIEKVLVA